MRRLLLGGLLMLLPACLPCPQVDCANTNVISVTDSSGAAVTRFSGVIYVGNDRFRVGCGGDSAPDAGTSSTDGGQQFVADAICDGNTIRTFNNSFGTDVRAELSGGGKSFNGIVTFVSDPPAKDTGACSVNCPVSRGTVVLQ